MLNPLNCTFFDGPIIMRGNNAPANLSVIYLSGCGNFYGQGCIARRGSYVCSGCAGDYERDFEFEYGAEPARSAHGDQPGASSRRGFDEPASECDANGVAGFEAAEAPRLTRQSRRLGRNPRCSAEESCEIMVSATQIIEIRVIANQDSQESEVPREARAQAPLTGKHSRPASANYYRTRGGVAVAGCGDREQGRGLCPIATLAVRALGRWARRARTALQW